MTTPVETPPAAQAAPATPPAPSPADMPPTQPQAAAAPTADKSELPSPVEEKELARARKDAATYREKLRETEQTAAALEQAMEEMRTSMTTKLSESDDRWNKLASIFNPEADAPPTAEELAAQWDLKSADFESKLSERDSQLTAAQESIRALTIRAALPNLAAKAKAHPEGLVKVLTADGVLGKLDPTSDTFAADLESAVNAAVEANPYLKVTPAATRSGAEIPGRTGGSDQLTREQVNEMSKRDPAALVKAQREGRLTRVLGGG